MKIKPKVTVYITNHNYGEYLVEAIESVLYQTYDNFELIIIDDGSTDNSRELLKKYQQFDNVRIIYQQNSGLTISNNIALKQATGEFIVRLDADDYFDKNALKILVNEFESEKIGLVFGDWYVVNQGGEILGIEKRHDFEREVSLYDQPAHGACSMFRTEFLREIGGYDETISRQDGFELWFRFIKKYEIRNINIPIFYYRKHGSSLTDKSEELLATRSYIYKKVVEQAENIEEQDALAIFPIRGEKLDRRSNPFARISGDYLVDISIDNFLRAQRVREIVISTPDKHLLEYIKLNYSRYPVKGHYRTPDIAYIGTTLKETMKLLQDELDIKSRFKVFATHSIESPFLDPHFIDSAVNVYSIFDVDTVISVLEDDSFYFTHDGGGMTPLNYSEDIIKYEKKKWYRNVTGFQIRDMATYFSNFKMLGSKVGHIILDRKSAFTIKDELDLDIANYLRQ